MTMHQNKKGNRAAAAIVLTVLGAAVAWWGIGLRPGEGASPGAGAEKATSSAAEYAADPAPVVWYEDDGLYLYKPGKKETVKLTGLKDGGMDRMTLLYTEKNPADMVFVLPDGTGAYYLKDLNTDFVGTTLGDLWYTPLPEKGDPSGEMLTAGQVMSCDLLSDGSIIWLDSNMSLWTLSDTPDKKDAEPQKIAAGVKEYHISDDAPEVFLVSETGKGYFFGKYTGKQPVAEDIGTVDFVSDDLRKIYYRTETKDLFYVEDAGVPQVVDVDVEEVSFVKKTGNLYYLKTGTGAAQVSSGTGTAQGSSGTGTGAAQVSSGTGAALPPADQTELTPEEEELVNLRVEELLQQMEGDTGYQLCFFDGTAHRDLLRGVTGVDSSHLDEIENDRAVVYTGLKDGYSIWLMMGEKPLYTGLSAADEGLMDLCPDMVRDVLYVSRQRADQIGTPDQGGIYAMRYTEKGFTNPEPLFDGAVIISAARDGKVYAGTYPIPDDGSTLIVDGEKISDHVASFFWDENGVSEKLQLYRNVFYQDYYVSGEVDDWSKEDGIRPIAYNVREYHGFKDGSFTMLCDYNEDELAGTLVYWDGTGDPVKLSGRASGTRTGDGEK